MTKRVLFLACHLPYPPYSGGRRREFELIKRVGRDFDIQLCAVSKTFEEDSVNVSVLDAWCSDVRLFRADPIEHQLGGEPVLPFQEVRHASHEMTRYLATAIETFRPDVIHAEGFYLMQHLPPDVRIPVLLVEQNVEYMLWRQKAETASRRDERDRRLREYLLTLESETRAWLAASMCATVTAEDRDAILAAEPTIDVRVVPDGADHLRLPDAVHAPRSGMNNVIAFVANFAYEPNTDAAIYLLRKIFPRVRSRVPGAQLLLVGNEPPPGVVELANGTRGVTVTGRVAEVEPYIESATVIACPLRIGGGIKVKVLEALSRGKAIVTTSVGAQGLGPQAGRAMEIHDRPIAFSDALVQLLRRPRLRAALEQRAAEFSRTLPTWDDAADELAACYDELSGERRARAAGASAAVTK